MNRAVIGIVAALLTALPAWTAAQDPAAIGWLGRAVTRRLSNAPRKGIPFAGRSHASPRRCDVVESGLRAARDGRHRQRRGAPDDRRVEAGVGQHPGAARIARARCASRRTTHGARGREPAARPDREDRTRDAGAGRRRAARLFRRQRVDLAAAVRVRAVRGDVDRAAHERRSHRHRRVSRGADRVRRREPLGRLRQPGPAARVHLEAQGGRSPRDAAAAGARAHHRARRARRGDEPGDGQRARRGHAGDRPSDRARRCRTASSSTRCRGPTSATGTRRKRRSPSRFSNPWRPRRRSS